MVSKYKGGKIKQGGGVKMEVAVQFNHDPTGNMCLEQHVCIYIHLFTFPR